MIRLILVRHGNTFESHETPTMVGVRSDLSLTARGCEQARQFAQYLLFEKIRPDVIFAGGLKRQIETAKIVKEELALDRAIESHEAALTEIDYGAWEGLAQEEILNHWSKEYSAWADEAKWAAGIFGRTGEEHLRDIKHWIEHLRASYAPGNTAIGVTSNGVMRFFYSLRETEWKHYVAERRIEQLKVKTGHFCELHIFQDLVKIKRWNIKP